jgi:phage gp29-like protein
MQLLRPLVGFNFGWNVPVPWFRFNLQEPEDLKAISEVYTNVIGFGQPVAAEHVSDRFWIPMPEEGQTVLAPAKPQGLFPMKSTTKTADAAKMAQDRLSLAGTATYLRGAEKSQGGGQSANFTPEQEEIEELVDVSLRDAVEAMQSLEKPVRAMIAGASSLEEVRDKILELYAGMNLEDLERTLADAMATAALFALTTAGSDRSGGSVK